MNTATHWIARGILSAAASCAVLSGCASSSSIVAADKPGTMTVSASAAGGRMAWARAHKLALAQANDYCDHLGMQTSFSGEHREGLEAMQQQNATVEFECHPKF